ncbi:MAG: leucine-rich repeat domain-containing protein [Muribaculaceae bacterium]|nr:leucine-rich repeat domain-containing protein [Muribaculaceae bacterium]
MKILILKKFFAAIIIPAVLCASCSNDDGPKNPAEALSITIKADGSTSNGAKFSPASNDSFYLDYVLYQIVDSHLEVIGCDKSEIKGDIKIYSPINYLGVSYNVRKINQQAFYKCEKITNINLPDCIQDIGYLAFAYCRNLISINLPTELEFIPDGCFRNCSNIIQITIPQNISSIGVCAFYECGELGDLTIPSSCEDIYNHAFGYCKFNKVLIENGVEYIYWRAFYHCDIEEITLPKTLQYIEDRRYVEWLTKGIFTESNINKLTAYFYQSYWKDNQISEFLGYDYNIKELIIY